MSSCVAALLLLRRVGALEAALAKAVKSAAALEKQAANMREAYLKLHDESEQGGSEKTKALEKAAKDAKADALEAAAKSEQAEKESREAKASAKALQRQAEGTHAEYARLLAENESLKQQLRDLDDRKVYRKDD